MGNIDVIETISQPEMKVVEVKSPMQIINNAVASGMNVSDMKELFEMHKDWQKTEAIKAYNNAMAKAQAKMPTIIKTKKNKQTDSMYADLGDIIKVIKPIYTKHGLSVSFNEGKADIESEIRIIGVCKHDDGHSEEFFTDLPIDNVGIQGKVNKTGIHGKGSTLSYGQRYLIKLIFNLSIDDEDDDGQLAGENEHNNIMVTKGERIGINYMRHCWLHYEAIQGVKDNLADDNLLGAAEYYCSLTSKEQMDIKRAPTKGGIFTIEEMKKMSGPEWNEAIQEGIKLNPDVDRSI